MKKRVILLVLMIFALAACSQDNTVPDHPNSDLNENQVTKTSDEALDETEHPMSEQMDSLSFKEYELDLDFNDSNDSFNIEFKKRGDGSVEAEYKDARKNINTTGEEAFNMLYPKLRDMDITSNTPREEVISKSLKAFDIEKDYSNLELEIVFNDGEKKEYEGENK